MNKWSLIAISKSVNRDEIGGILGVSGTLEAITCVIAPTLGGYLLEQVDRWVPGVFSALIMVWVITFSTGASSCLPAVIVWS